ncbi:MAG: hypothetical protein LBR37_03185 [Erysipelotrichaceae bacterium]|jgi:hypothetical protein|nr:hypothetical protein [Erysipelotrichaceae bacterium]
MKWARIKSILNQIMGHCYFSNRRLKHYLKKNKVEMSSPREYLIGQYQAVFKRMPNLDEPRSYNEKLLWIKLNYHNDSYKILTDKIAVKDYLERLGLGSYVIPTYGVYDSPDLIDYSLLPDSFVIKVNNDSGGVVLVNDKNTINHSKINSFLASSLKRNYFQLFGEWNYNFNGRVIVEKLISPKPLNDYKFLCFSGKVEYMYVASDRQNFLKFNFYKRDFTPIKVIQGHPRSHALISKPKSFDLMIQIAELIASKFPHIRVDFYEVEGQLYLGELTFFHMGGMYPFYPKQFDIKLGSLLDLTMYNKE